MTILHKIPYDADEMAQRQQQLIEWEKRLKDAEEALKHSKSSNYVHLTIVWANTRDVRDYLQARINAMLKDIDL
jgi:hypothetical protein